MKQIILAIILGAVLADSGMAQTNVINKATRLEDKGKFTEAAALLKKAIDSKKYSGDGEKALEFQLDLLHRIKQDYSTSKEDLFAALHKEIKDFNQQEFEKWIKAGWFDTREIDGKPYFFDSSVANLWFRHPELNARRFSPADKSSIDHWRLETITSIEKASAAEHSPYVLPKTFHVTMRVTAKADAVPDGDIVRTWIPIPRQYPFQDNFKMLTTSFTPKEINPADSPIRSVYFEEPAQHGKPTEFKIEYEYTVHGVHFDLQPDKIQPYDPKDEAVKLYTRESPHVIFTPEIKALSAKIVGNETNPMLKAKKIFEWLSDSLLYSYATEYSTIPNISDYCRSHGYGDCGQQGMLFITLCRYNGVPARWQSGWDFTPGSTSNHDWSEIYLTPYGWVPVDQYMGNHAMRYIKSLTPAQVLQIRDFYFGGLDQYRMIANSDHSVALSPAKKFFRSDDVDFQRGEVEDSAKNLYFDDFSYKLTYKELPSPAVP